VTHPHVPVPSEDERLCGRARVRGRQGALQADGRERVCAGARGAGGLARLRRRARGGRRGARLPGARAAQPAGGCGPQCRALGRTWRALSLSETCMLTARLLASTLLSANQSQGSQRLLPPASSAPCSHAAMQHKEEASAPRAHRRAARLHAPQRAARRPPARRRPTCRCASAWSCWARVGYPNPCPSPAARGAAAARTPEAHLPLREGVELLGKGRVP